MIWSNVWWPIDRGKLACYAKFCEHTICFLNHYLCSRSSDLSVMMLLFQVMTFRSFSRRFRWWENVSTWTLLHITAAIWGTVCIELHCCWTVYTAWHCFQAQYMLPSFSALTLLVGRQEGHPACKKLKRWGAGVVICLEWGADLHMAQLMLLPLTVSCFSKIQTGFTFLVPVHLGSPRKRPIKRVCVCICYRYLVCPSICVLLFNCLSVVPPFRFLSH